MYNSLMEPLRILLVDDHLLFRKGLARLLDAQPDFQVVGEAADGQEAVEKARLLSPDVVLMDIMMPSCDGLTALHRIKAQVPRARVVVLTVSDREEDLAEAIRRGADGYLLKDILPETLFQQLRGLTNGEVPLSKPMVAKLVRLLRRELEHKASGSAQPAPTTALSPREAQVLAMVVEGHSNEEIARRLGIACNTVKNHLRNILRKLGVRNRAQAAAYALRHGLVKFPERIENTSLNTYLRASHTRSLLRQS